MSMTTTAIGEDITGIGIINPCEFGSMWVHLAPIKGELFKSINRVNSGQVELDSSTKATISSNVM